MSGFGYLLIAAGVAFIVILLKDFGKTLARPSRLALFDPDNKPEHIGLKGFWSKAYFPPLALWTLTAMVFALYLLFIAFVALFYSFALIYGEFAKLLEVVPPTAGNIIIHLCYPIQVLLMAFLLLTLFCGMVRVIWGATPLLDRIGIRTRNLSQVMSECSRILALIFAVVLLKLAAFISAAPPEELSLFFARHQSPRLEPLPLVVLFLMTGLLLLIRSRVGPGDDDDHEPEADHAR